MKLPKYISTTLESLLIAIGFVAATSTTSVLHAYTPSERPNILFILIDDFGYYDVGYNGETFYETPEIDALAKEWMRLDNFYTPSPMCSPTRASILTGKNPARHGITQWLSGSNKAYTKKGEAPRVYCPAPQSLGIQENETTLGESFQEAGYDTAFYGKWHMGKLRATGGPKNHGYASQLAVIEENGARMFGPFGRYFPDSKKGDNFTDLLTDSAIEFISKDRSAPFYLHLSYFSMHSPIKSKLELRKHFEDKANSLPSLKSPSKNDPFSNASIKIRRDSPEYAGQLLNLDRNVGRLVASLKSTGQYENTIVVFTGDNGGRTSNKKPHPTSNAPLRAGKTFLFEGGLKTPTMIHWPGHTEAGSISNALTSSMDFYPTLLEMAGLGTLPEQHIDGVSLVPLFRGGNLERDTLYWHFPHYQKEGGYPSSAIRVGNYKLIYDYHHDEALLFNISEDPYEQSNLAQAAPEKTEELRKRLMDYLEARNASIPQTVEK